MSGENSSPPLLPRSSSSSNLSLQLRKLPIFHKAGASLRYDSWQVFNQIKTKIKLCSMESLGIPDVFANQSCRELIQSVIASHPDSDEILTEVVFYMAKKVPRKNPIVDYLLLSLIETLMVDCGEPFHLAMNSEHMMSSLEKLIRHYKHSKSDRGVDCFSMAVDLLQCWGEAFRFRPKEFAHILSLYGRMKDTVTFKDIQSNVHAPLAVNQSPQRTSTSVTSARSLSFEAIPRRRTLSSGADLYVAMNRHSLKAITGRESLKSPRCSAPKVLSLVEELLSYIYSCSSNEELRNNANAARLANTITSALTKVKLETDLDVETVELVYFFKYRYPISL